MTRSAEPEAPAAVVHVGGDVSKPGDWCPGLLRTQMASEIKSIPYTVKGVGHKSDCVPLLTLLKAAGVQTEVKMDPKADPKTKHAQLRLVVIVEASDGYTVLFSLAELMPLVGHHPVWLALDMDGEPLNAHDGPIKLLVPDDAMPVRWVHGVKSISIVDATVSAARQP